MAGADATPAPSRSLIRPKQTVPARDGVSLVTDVYLPPQAETAPVVLVRTPYGRTLPFLLLLSQQLSRSGYGVVVQDSRGRYQSGGTFELGREHEDTEDTLLWLRDQPWCDGRVALLGLSFSSHANFAAAVGGLPDGIELGGIISIMGVIDYHSLFYRGGAMILHWALPWVTILAGDRGTFSSGGLAGRSWRELLRHQPLADLPEELGIELPMWRLLTAHPAADGGWEGFDLRPRLLGLPAPTLHISGWFDFMLGQTVDAYRSVTLGDEGRARRHRLVVGPWDHRSIFYSFKQASEEEAGGGTSIRGLLTDWLDHWMPGAAVPEVPAPESAADGCLLFQLEADRWLELPTFPASPEVSDRYLSAAGAGMARGTGGGLLERPSPRLGTDTFAYDPANPVPTVGGAVWPFSAIGLQPGAVDQSSVEERPDVLTYTSERLDEDLDIAGYTRVELWVASSALDTDFTAKLVDLRPSGEALLVQDGILRGRFRDGPAQPRPMEPNRPYRFIIELGPIAYRFRRNHRLRLEVSSSNFPKFDRNPNAGAPLYTTPSGSVAQQVVFSGAKMPSRLRLPLLAV